jgi:hypothetical protein
MRLQILPNDSTRFLLDLDTFGESPPFWAFALPPHSWRGAFSGLTERRAH